MLPYLTALFVIPGILSILTVKQSVALAACVLRATTKKGDRQLFKEKKCIR